MKSLVFLFINILLFGYASSMTCGGAESYYGKTMFGNVMWQGYSGGCNGTRYYNNVEIFTPFLSFNVYTHNNKDVMKTYFHAGSRNVYKTDFMSYYGKFSDTVYYKGKKIKLADYKTFGVLGGGYSYDKNNIYFGLNVYGDSNYASINRLIEDEIKLLKSPSGAPMSVYLGNWNQKVKGDYIIISNGSFNKVVEYNIVGLYSKLGLILLIFLVFLLSGLAFFSLWHCFRRFLIKTK